MAQPHHSRPVLHCSTRCWPAAHRPLWKAHYATNPSLGNDPRCGLLLDEWTEVAPATKETTGIAVNYDQPDSEPPQAMLLVVPPVKTGTWQVDDLVAAVNETFDLAKTRAVEPAHLDDTAYAHLLPATVMSAHPPADHDQHRSRDRQPAMESP
jgi:hypothetical protein